MMDNDSVKYLKYSKLESLAKFKVGEKIKNICKLSFAYLCNQVENGIVIIENEKNDMNINSLSLFLPVISHT